MTDYALYVYLQTLLVVQLIDFSKTFEELVELETALSNDQIGTDSQSMVEDPKATLQKPRVSKAQKKRVIFSERNVQNE